MTREEYYAECLKTIGRHRCLLLEASTGYGKTRIAIDLVNHLCDTVYKGRKVRMLLLVAKRVHKGEWQREFDKWGGIKADEVVTECYESLRKHINESFDVAVFDECFRGDTEILTNSGYKQFKDLTEDDLVAQFTQEGNIEFVKPTRLIKRRHTGEICKLHLGRNRYCYLTPNHNMVYKTPWIDGWRMKPVKDLGSYNKVVIPVSGKGTGNNEPLTTLERLLIAVQADGALQRHQLHASVYSITVKKERKKERLKLLLSDFHNWTQIDKYRDYDRYLLKLPIGDHKLLSNNFDVNMGYERANAFIEEVMEWDGSKCCEGNTIYYSSKIKENADFVAAVAIQAGYKVLQSVEIDERKDNHSPIYRLFLRRIESISTEPMTKEYLPYDDDVYCVEVPTHMIVVRSEGYSFIAGNCHHIASETRMELLKKVRFTYCIGLSATIPYEVKQFFKWNYRAQVIKCDIVEAIEDEVLPEPQILLLPLKLDNTQYTETWEVNPKAPGMVYEDEYRNKWQYIKQRKHAVLRCTQKQKSNELNQEVLSLKNRYMATRNEGVKNIWLQKCGLRLEFYAASKIPVVKEILMRLKNFRTITFCKTIEHCEQLGKNCIHSKNGKLAMGYYNDFNAKKIKHITAVNILNEGANLVDCKYAVFGNLSASDIIMPQRIGRALRHKEPVLIVPYYEGTREEELVQKAFEDYNKNCIKVIHSIDEII